MRRRTVNVTLLWKRLPNGYVRARLSPLSYGPLPAGKGPELEVDGETGPKAFFQLLKRVKALLPDTRVISHHMEDVG